MIELDTTEIHVWLSFCNEINDPLLLDFYLSLLSREEKQQQSRFHFSSLQRRYLVTRAMVRLVLSRYAFVRPEEWRFRVNEYGRPAVLMPHGEEEQIFFNVSHTTGLIVLAVARRRALGVDVENLEASEMPVDVADRFFASSEVTALLALPSSQQQDRFFEYWTFKESYIKARGMGLSIPLDKFSFDFPSDRGVTLSIDTTLSDVAENWRFWQFRPRKEYLIAIWNDWKYLSRRSLFEQRYQVNTKP
jgi:4'-phosphopantetheinyl transferase